MVTLKDVARLAGVAPSTVSRIINDKADKAASAAVKERVWAVVRETGYIPNSAARGLKTGARESGQPVISCLFARGDDAREDSYFLELAAFVSQEILRQGCRVGPQYTVSQAQRCPVDFAPEKTDGLVILGKTQGDCTEFLDRFRKRVAYVTLNQSVLGRDHIACDGRLATQTALQHLYDKGHRTIGYVGEQAGEVRYAAYRAFLAENKLPFEQAWIVPAHMDKGGGRAAAQRLCEAPQLPTAVFCANDATAIGLLEALRRQGVCVPQQLSVISIDDIAEAADAAPPLTTVKIPLNELGGMAVKILLDRIHKGHIAYLNVFVPSRLVVRDSVGAPRAS